MTSSAAFDAEDWSLITAAPLLIGLRIVAAERGGTARETLAISRAYANARGYYDRGLMQDVVSTPPSLGFAAAPRGAEDLRVQAPNALRRAVAILARKATDDEVNNYKRFVFYVAETVAQAHREGGVLGIGGTEISESEQAALDEIADILDEQQSEAPEA